MMTIRWVRNLMRVRFYSDVELMDLGLRLSVQYPLSRWRISNDRFGSVAASQESSR
jgi:hypothetical protein